MFFQLLGRLISTLTVVWLLAPTATAQVDTLFRLSPDDRILRLWQAAPFFAIDHPPYLKVHDSTRVFEQLDQLADFAQREEDDRLFWYVQLHKILFRHTLLRVDGKPSTVLQSAQSYVERCPIPVVRASYWYHRGRYCFDEQHQFDEGFRWLLRAQHTFEQIGYGHIPEISEYLSGLGGRYYFFGEYATCIRYMLASFRYPPWVKRAEITAHNTVGLCYQHLHHYAQAQAAFLQTLTLARTRNDSAYIAIANTNLGHLLLLQNQFRPALAYLYKGYRFSWPRLAESRVPENAALTALYLAKALSGLDSVAKAKTYINASTRLFTNRPWSDYDLHYYQARMTYYKKVGDFRSAMVYLDSTQLLAESLQKMFNTRLLAASQAQVSAERYLHALDRAEAEKVNAILVRNVILVALLLVGLAGGYALHQNRQKRLQEKQVLLAQKQQAEELLNQYMGHLQEKNEFINTTLAELHRASQTKDIEPSVNDLMDRVILTDADWQQFKHLFEGVYPGFFRKLKERYPNLTGAEIRLLALSKLQIDTRQMSRMLGISPESIHKTKYRMRKKMDIDGRLYLAELLSNEKPDNLALDK